MMHPRTGSMPPQPISRGCTTSVDNELANIRQLEKEDERKNCIPESKPIIIEDAKGYPLLRQLETVAV